MTPSGADLRVTAAARTDVGRVRSQNEDACLVRPGAGLVAVADGMGGHAAGEVASRLAVEALDERLGDAADTDDGEGGALTDQRGSASGAARLPATDASPWSDLAGAKRAVREAVEEANGRIHRQARENPDQHGMGTTVTALLFAGPRRWVMGHVGDSRAYLLRDAELTRVTTDHTVVPGSSTLTRALGTRADVEVDVLDGGLEAGDVFLLCSDGLTDMMSYDDVHDLLAHALAGGDVERAADALVEEVLERGAHDNVTVVLTAVREG